jgi:hypothetical protein
MSNASKFTRFVACIALTLLAASSIAHAAIIASVSGPEFFATGLGAGNGQQAVAMGFSTIVPLANVSFSSPISVGFENTNVTAYLTNSLGSGTTQANVIAQTTINVPVNTTNPNDNQFTTVNFFNFNILPAGSYYMSLIETDGTNEAGNALILSGSQVFTFPPGVTFLGTFLTSEQGGTFAPGFNYSNPEDASLFGGDEAFTVTGTLVPEPTTLLPLALILFLSRRRRLLPIPIPQ